MLRRNLRYDHVCWISNPIAEFYFHARASRLKLNTGRTPPTPCEVQYRLVINLLRRFVERGPMRGMTQPPSGCAQLVRLRFIGL